MLIYEYLCHKEIFSRAFWYDAWFKTLFSNAFKAIRAVEEHLQTEDYRSHFTIDHHHFGSKSFAMNSDTRATTFLCQATVCWSIRLVIAALSVRQLDQTLSGEHVRLFHCPPGIEGRLYTAQITTGWERSWLWMCKGKRKEFCGFNRRHISKAFNQALR